MKNYKQYITTTTTIEIGNFLKNKTIFYKHIYNSNYLTFCTTYKPKVTRLGLSLCVC